LCKLFHLFFDDFVDFFCLLLNFLCVCAETLLSSMFLSPVRGTHQEAVPPLDDASKLLCSSVLTCLSHYFSWAPLEATLTPRLLTTIFKFAAFGCEGKGGRGSASAQGSLIYEII
jgi:hypothetical protein